MIQQTRQIPALGDRGKLALVGLLLAIACWPTVGTAVAALWGGDPRFAAGLVPILGGLLLLRRFDTPGLKNQPKDPFINGLVLFALIVAAGITLFLLPVLLSWGYWLDRWDIPAVILLLMTLLVAIWGLPALLQLGLTLPYLLLAWPLAYQPLLDRASSALIESTAASLRALAPRLTTAIAADPEALRAVIVTHGHHLSRLAITGATSGLGTVCGALVLGLPVVFAARGPLDVRWAWLAVGIAAAWAVNLAGLLVACALAAASGDTWLVRIVQPAARWVELAIVAALGLALLPAFRLTLPLDRSEAARWPAEAAGQLAASLRMLAALPALILGPHRPKLRRAALFATIAVVAAICEQGLGAISWISPQRLPYLALVTAADTLPPIPGWQRSTGSLAGLCPVPANAPGYSASLSLRGPEGQVVPAQILLTPDTRVLSGAPLEDCLVLQGVLLRASRRVSLGSGITAEVLSLQSRAARGAALSWVQAVETPLGRYYERIALFGPASAALVAGAASVRQENDTYHTVAYALENLLSPVKDRPVDPADTSSEALLRALGRSIIAQERTGMGKGAMPGGAN